MKRQTTNFKILLLINLILNAICSLNFNVSYAQEKETIGTVSNVIGKVELIRDGKTVKIQKDNPIFETDIIRTGESGAIKINFKDGSNYMAFNNTEFNVLEYKLKNNKSGGVNLKGTINLVKGAVRFFVKPKQDGINDVKATTPNAVMLVRGTAFLQKCVGGSGTKKNKKDNDSANTNVDVDGGKSYCQYDMEEGAGDIFNKEHPELHQRLVKSFSGKIVQGSPIVRIFKTPEIAKINNNKLIETIAPSATGSSSHSASSGETLSEGIGQSTSDSDKNKSEGSKSEGSKSEGSKSEGSKSESSRSESSTSDKKTQNYQQSSSVAEPVFLSIFSPDGSTSLQPITPALQNFQNFPTNTGNNSNLAAKASLSQSNSATSQLKEQAKKATDTQETVINKTKASKTIKIIIKNIQ